MSTMNYVNSANTKLGVLHKSLIGDSNQHDVTRTTVSTKLIVRRYPLSANRVRGKKMEHCILCGKEEEDEKHFLLLCEALQETRLPHLNSLLRICRENGTSIDPENLTRIIINPVDHYGVSAAVKICKNLIFKLHLKRSELLNPNRKEAAVPKVDFNLCF